MNELFGQVVIVSEAYPKQVCDQNSCPSDCSLDGCSNDCGDSCDCYCERYSTVDD